MVISVAKKKKCLKNKFLKLAKWWKEVVGNFRKLVSKKFMTLLNVLIF